MSGPAYLSDPWFDLARTRVAPAVGERPGLRCAVQFQMDRTGDPIRWLLSVDDGRITDWRRGDLAEPDVEVRMDLSLAWRAFQGAADANEVLSGCTVVERRGDTTWTGPPAPMDLAGAPELDQLLPVPGASLDVQYEFSASPFGLVSFALSITDGRVEEMFLGQQAEADVVVRTTYLQMARVRRGDIGIIDVLVEGATVEGPEGALALLAGVSESPEFHRAELACGRSGLALGTIGEVWSAPGCREALSALAAETEPPDGI